VHLCVSDFFEPQHPPYFANQVLFSDVSSLSNLLGD
jgi:hypothetical protein